MLRFIIAFLITTLATLPALAQPTTQVADCTARSAVLNGAVNLRTGPGFDFAPLSAIRADMTVEVIARTDNDWVQVQQIMADGVRVGFMPLGRLLLAGDCAGLPLLRAAAFATPAAGPTATVPPPLPTITPTVVNPAPTETAVCTVTALEAAPLRDGPGDAYDFYDTLQPGMTYIGITRSDTGWLELGTVERASRLVGWAAPDSIEATADCAALPLVRVANYDPQAWYPSR